MRAYPFDPDRLDGATVEDEVLVLGHIRFVLLDARARQGKQCITLIALLTQQDKKRSVHLRVGIVHVRAVVTGIRTEVVDAHHERHAPDAFLPVYVGVVVILVATAPEGVDSRLGEERAGRAVDPVAHVNGIVIARVVPNGEVHRLCAGG